MPKNLYCRVMGISEPFNVGGGVIIHFVNLAEMHAFGFIAQDFKTVFHGPFQYLLDALLHFSFNI